MSTPQDDQTPEQARNEAISLMYSAVVRALFDTGHQGANADTTHPLRQAWEQCREAERLAVASGVLRFDAARPLPQATLSEETAGRHLRAIVSHWNEFGPEHGLGEAIDAADRFLARAVLASRPVAVGYVPRCHTDGENRIVGEIRWDEASERPFAMNDPEHWECLPLYAPSSESLPVGESQEAKDAARYRWLRDKAKRTQPKNWPKHRGGEVQVLRWCERDEADILHSEELDAAIDAALSCAPEEKP